MRFSLWLFPYGRWDRIEAMGDAALLAEQLGFASVSVSDHIVCPRGPEADGVTPVWPDWSALSTYLATRTSTLRIVASLVVPYRSPLILAKQIATIDAISGGRFTLAAAVGWLRTEFDMLGVPHDQRGAITDEYLRALKVLWTEPNPSFEGRYVRFSDIIVEPRCAQEPHVPIWIAGGTARAVLRRALELGDGWMPMGGGLSRELTEAMAYLRDEVARRDRDPLTFRCTIGIGTSQAALTDISKSIAVPDALALTGTPDDVAAGVAQYAEAGYDELAINFAGQSRAAVMEELEWFGTEVMPLLPRTASAV